ncbi:lysophospholipid acyltransferase family protein [Brevundimonas naejangsanensis]|uniref:lysophospholipid acyltransferase family protein n=1 Tax=Brevundimonas naejangsanensis TaxID=588932 RepID=UPI0039F71350
MPGDQTRSSRPKGGSAHRDDQTRSSSPKGGSAHKEVPFLQDLNWRLEAAAFQGLFGFLRLLGVERASGFGGKLLRTLGPLTGTHKTVTRNLRIAFPDMDEGERSRLAVDQWEQTGRTFAELAVMDRLTPESGRIELVGMERLHAIRDSGRPVVLISGHLANFEVMAAVIMAAGVPCQVTYRAANNPYVDALIRQSRERYGIKLFAPKGDGTRELMAGMKRGESIALLVDQKYSQGPEVEFFGQPVNASPGAARMALKFGTVMQPLSVVRLPGVRFRVTAHEPIAVPDTGDKAADVWAGVQAANRFVEDRVREHPVDWFWVHKRWPPQVYEALREAEA